MGNNCAMKILFDQLQAANQNKFSYRISDRLSSSNSNYKEQYAYVWRNSKVNVTTDFFQAVNTAIERPPFIGRFENFGKVFYTLPIHTRPGEAFKEVDALDDLWSAYVEAENIPASEQNAVILGDLNFGKNIDANTCSLSSTCESMALEQGWDWLIDHTEDTGVAAGTQSYDRIVINFTNSIQQTCARANADPFITKAVSDHYPVEFFLKFV